MSGRTHRLAEALVAAGHEVVFVEMPSARKAVRWLWQTDPAIPQTRGIRVVRLCPLPWRIRIAAPRMARRWVRYAVRSLRRHVPQAAESILVTSTPWWAPVARELPAAVRCYDYLDHVTVQAGPGRTEHFVRWDEELLAASRFRRNRSGLHHKVIRLERFPRGGFPGVITGHAHSEIILGTAGGKVSILLQ